MKLWYLYGISDSGFDFGYERYFGFVIRAETEERARQIATDREHDSQWLDPDMATCEELTGEGEEGVILHDYHAG